METLSQRYLHIRDELGSRTSLIAVSKTKPAAEIEKLYELGQRDFGENKLQELMDKSIQLSHLKDLRWHFIGHLQSNKINSLLTISNLVSIHSIDSIKLLNKLVLKKTDKKIGLFIQINTSKEEEKGGFLTLSGVKEALEIIKGSTDFYVQGLMTIGSIRDHDFETSAHKCFNSLKLMSESLPGHFELSMGMSADYKIALEYGTNWVRLGSTIFGKR